MNKFQKAYALAKAQREVVIAMYRDAFNAHPEYGALWAEQEPLLDFEDGTPEYARSIEIEIRLGEIEREINERTGYTESREVLQLAEQAMVEWSFNALKKQPAAFVKAGIKYSDIAVLLPHMNNLYSPIRKKLIDLSFHFAS